MPRLQGRDHLVEARSDGGLGGRQDFTPTRSKPAPALVRLIASTIQRARRVLPGDNDEALADMILRDLRAARVRLDASNLGTDEDGHRSR